MSNVLVNETSLQNIASAIRTKNGSSDTYTPSEMATAIENIPSGTVNPTNYTQLNTAIYDASTSLANTMNALVDAKSAYTNDNVTLYTPDSKCTRYLIRKNTSNTYNAIWFGYDDTNYQASIPYVLFRGGYGFHLGKDYGEVYVNPNTSIPFKFNPTTNRYESNATSVAGIVYQAGIEFSSRCCYYSNALSTPEEIIQAMMNNTLTYTRSPGGYLNGNELLYSNFVVFGTNTETFNSSFVISDPTQAAINTPIISHNETIVSAS